MEEVKLQASLNTSSSLKGEISSNASLGGNIGKGVTKVMVNDHDLLLNRDLPDQHPMGAIEGLHEELMTIKSEHSTITLSIKNVNKKIDTKFRTVKEIPSDLQVGEYIFLEKGEVTNGGN